MAYISFNGTTSTSLGVEVLDYPPIVKPKATIETVAVPGRSGTLTLHMPEDVYEPVEKKVRCYLTSAATLTTVAAWLDGDGTLIIGNEPTYAYTARVTDQVSFDTIVAGRAQRVFEVTFACQPWKELASPDADITLSTNPQTIVSAATLDSLPLITLTGTGTCTLTVGAYTLSQASCAGATPILIDCEAMTVTNVAKSVSYIANMTGSFPKLVKGNNVVSHTGTVASVVIKPRYRWL